MQEARDAAPDCSPEAQLHFTATHALLLDILQRKSHRMQIPSLADGIRPPLSWQSPPPCPGQRFHCPCSCHKTPTSASNAAPPWDPVCNRKTHGGCQPLQHARCETPGTAESQEQMREAFACHGRAAAGLNPAFESGHPQGEPPWGPKD